MFKLLDIVWMSSKHSTVSYGTGSAGFENTRCESPFLFASQKVNVKELKKTL